MITTLALVLFIATPSAATPSAATPSAATPSAATPSAATPSARVVVLEGEAWATHEASAKAQLELGAALAMGDVVETSETGRVRLLFANRSVVDLGPSSRMALKETTEKKTSLRSFFGRIWARVASAAGNDQRFDIETANAVAGVRGTSFFLESQQEGDTTITVSAGSVEVTSDDSDKPVMLDAMHRGIFSRGKQARVDRQLSIAQITSLREGIAARASLGARAERLEDLRAHLGKRKIGRGLRSRMLRKGLRQRLRRQLMRRLAMDLDPAVAEKLLERLRQLRNK